MFGSQNKDILFEIYKDNKTVYNFKSIAILLGESNVSSLLKKINYNVKNLANC